MYDATCSKCGKACQVPFKPSGGRPVFCRDCFDKPMAGAGGHSRPFAGNSDRPRFEDRQMFEATCAKCGDKCQVPFRPIEGKPIFCSNCFEKKTGPASGGSFGGGNSGAGNTDQFKVQFASLNSKLDAILRALNGTPTPTPHTAKTAPAAEVKESKKEKTVSTKVKAAKKPLTKKKK